MRLIIEIAAADAFDVLHQRHQRRLRRGQGRQERRRLELLLQRRERRFARGALCRDQAAMRRKILRQLLRRQAVVGDVRSNAARSPLVRGVDELSGDAHSSLRERQSVWSWPFADECLSIVRLLLLKARVAQIELLQQLRSAGRDILSRAAESMARSSLSRVETIALARSMASAASSNNVRIWVACVSSIVSILWRHFAPEATSDRQHFGAATRTN